ncbi:MAG TPA: Com family DNA-binding transcriptional regulator, partial [Burkholderiaceae bacterium]|nr:Com family DNA-binding transcriptional regulator [Burkholderiaceae bacterium]
MKHNDIRCGHCARKLAEGQYVSLSIRCQRCGTVNHWANGPVRDSRAQSPIAARRRASDLSFGHSTCDTTSRTPPPPRPGAPSS